MNQGHMTQIQRLSENCDTEAEADAVPAYAFRTIYFPPSASPDTTHA
jgi:hypothetical protein